MVSYTITEYDPMSIPSAKRELKEDKGWKISRQGTSDIYVYINMYSGLRITFNNDSIDFKPAFGPNQTLPLVEKLIAITGGKMSTIDGKIQGTEQK